MDSRDFHYDDIPADDGFAEESCAPVEFFAGERVCPPGKVHRHPVRRVLAVIALAFGCGAAWIETPQELRDRIGAGIEAALVRATRSSEKAAAPLQATVAEPQTAAGESNALPPLPETREIAAVPAEEAGVPVSPESQAAAEDASPAAAAATETAAPEPLPPPLVDPADPYQKRALAVGLHPDLSRSLLARLSDDDYRNARLAIKTALAETPDSKVHAWPKEGGGAKLALFEVSFVRGATPECRRYVVTVTKNRWSTTALPMEKCGLKPRGKAAGAQ